MTRPRSDPRHDVLGRDWITRSAARASARLALDDADIKRLRRRGFKAAALDGTCCAGTTAATRPSCPSARSRIRSNRATAGCSRRSSWCEPRRCRRAASPPASRSPKPICISSTGWKRRARRCFACTGSRPASEPLDGETLRQGLKQEVMGVADGGEWEWAFNLIEKYGLVPSHRMPGTASANDTDALRVDLRERLARATRAIQRKPGEVRRDSRSGDARRGAYPGRSSGQPAVGGAGRAGARCRPPSMPSSSSVSAPANGGW